MSSFHESYDHLSDGRPVYFFQEGAETEQRPSRQTVSKREGET